jgi:hypothetical protein
MPPARVGTIYDVVKGYAGCCIRTSENSPFRDCLENSQGAPRQWVEGGVQRLNKASLPLITASQGTSLGSYPDLADAVSAQLEPLEAIEGNGKE